MKTWIFPLLALVIGTGLGAGRSLMNFEAPEVLFSTEESAPATYAPTDLDPNERHPKALLLSEPSYDFGVMARDSELSHSFQIKNVGTGALTLKILDTTCKCTVGNLDRNEIAPDETVDVTLTWRATTYEREFRQSATIETNSPSQREIILSVHGKVQRLVRPDPPAIALGRISHNDPQDYQIKVYSYQETKFELLKYELRESESARAFRIDLRPLPADQIDDPEAVSGQLVNIHIEAGLPLGALQQLLVLYTNSSDSAPIEIPISGTIISDITVLGGRDFNIDTNVLRLPLVAKEKGYETTLRLMVKGPHRDEVTFQVASTDPADVLQAEIGAAVTINNGLVRMIPLVVRIPPGARTVSRMGSSQGELGEIKLQATHPDIKELTIFVRFAIKN